MIAQDMTQIGRTPAAPVRQASQLHLEAARFAHGEKVVLDALTLDLAVTRLAVVGRKDQVLH